MSAQIAVSETWIALVFVGILYLFKKDFGGRRVARYLIIACIVRLLSDAYSWGFDGKKGWFFTGTLWVSNFLSFAMFEMVGLLFLFYVWESIRFQDERVDKVVYLYSILCCLSILSLTLNLFTGWFYTIDSNNVYRRGKFYGLSNISPMLQILSILWLLIRYRGRFSKNRKLMGWLYLCVMTFSTAYESVSFGLSLQTYSQTFSVIIVFLISELEFRKSLEKMQNSLTEYNNIIANAGLGIWHIILKYGKKPRMQANAKMLEIMGIDPDTEMYEEEIYDFWYSRITPGAVESVQNSVSEMMSGKFSENTYKWEHPTKGTVYVRCGGTARKFPGGTTILRGYHGDVTQIVLGEQKQKEELALAREQAESANNAKSSFLFNMSHDIRTPMNAIIGFRELLEKHQDEPEKRADYLKKIEDASNVLLSIINNVLEMARIEKGTLILDEVAWSAEQFNDSLFSVFDEMMKQKNILFTRELNVEHHFVYCDAIKLREVYINVLSNAYKYTDEGGCVKMILTELPSEREGYVLYETTIIDSGRGMSEEFLPHIFEEFARENTTTKSKVEGTGLGMPIVKRLVDFMDGTITVESKKEVGTKFVITIPHRIAEEKDLLIKPDLSIDPMSFKGKRILLAEDNDLNAEIAEEILTEAGFVIERAEDGEVAVEMVMHNEPFYYDLILMDIQMPHLNGYDATRTIRALKDTEKAEIPIIAMTANAFEEDKREAYKAGMNGHLAKPVKVDDLMKMLSRVL